MLITRALEATRDAAQNLRRKHGTLALVPTMGALHEGHLSLVRLARRHANAVAVSLFVNPTQFGPAEDFSAYPRTWDQDCALCKAEDVALLFAPTPGGMYAADHSTFVVPEALEAALCGRSRPGHFRGVLTVVAKLFNIVQPDCAVFGEKDAQQLRLIERMVRDLNFPVRIVRGPILREADGLAMSSRNRYLSAGERAEAVALHEALEAVRRAFAAGERLAEPLRALLRERVAQARHGRLDYAEIVDDSTLAPVDHITGKTLVALAVHFGKARLIDNLVLDPDDLAPTSA